MNPTDLCNAKPLSEVLPADKARQLVQLVLAMWNGGAAEVVEIRDEFGVIGHFVPAMKYLGLPPYGTPEFEEEIRRRMESTEPVIPAEEFIAWLEALPLMVKSD